MPLPHIDIPWNIQQQNNILAHTFFACYSWRMWNKKKVTEKKWIIGVKSFDVKLDSQTADVVTEPSVSYDTVLATIKKTGKAVNSGEADGQTMAVWLELPWLV